MRAIARYARLVALPHTVFSLPFALGAAAVAGRHSHPSAARYFWIVVAVAAARTAAMAFNRWADRDFDRMNARTAGRALPRGLVSPAGALLLTATASALFLVSAWQLGKLPLLLSPLALAVCLGYSLAKRVTNLSHLVLGVALAGAPMGAWIAITGGLSRGAVALSGAVAAWVAGFDLIYACQDVEFDRGHGLGSIPARWGIAMALRASIATRPLPSTRRAPAPSRASSASMAAACAIDAPCARRTITRPPRRPCTARRAERPIRSG